MPAIPNWHKTKWGKLKDDLYRLGCELEFFSVPAFILVLIENSSNPGSWQNCTFNKKDKLSECEYCHEFGQFFY